MARVYPVLPSGVKETEWKVALSVVKIAAVRGRFGRAGMPAGVGVMLLGGATISGFDGGVAIAEVLAGVVVCCGDGVGLGEESGLPDEESIGAVFGSGLLDEGSIGTTP